MNGLSKLLAVILPVVFMVNRPAAQCVSPITSFPYSEGFEVNAGGWTTGGNSSDWTWGTPSKSVINGAGQGNRCWITGGLTGNRYNDNEFAWLQSPCFNLSSLANPRISFLVCWETERRYDGATFQYSLDGGTSWATLGTDNSNSTCAGTQWYNFSPINFLGNQPGWSGNIQPTSGSCLGGNGSNGWVQASHSLSQIAGNTQVIFRFLFAAGATCNQYNGFAVDNIVIDEAPPAGTVDFSYQCLSSNSVSFSNLTLNCRSSVAWDFGDPVSGASNTATGDNPTHVFSGPGNYSVSMTVTFTNGQTSQTSKSVTILSASTSVITPILCNGDNDGEVQVTVTGGSGSYFYNWNTNPVQTGASATGLSSGSYTVSISSINTCNLSATVNLAEPAAVSALPAILNETCGNGRGSIALSVSGGTAPYDFNWSNGASASLIENLSAGSYSVDVSDANGCSGSLSNLEVRNVINNLSPQLGRDTFLCPGSRLILQPGNFLSYLWQDGSTASGYTVTETGTYSVTVRDENNCTGSASITVTVDCSDIYFPSAFTPNNDGLNETFGPLGNLAGLRDYSLSIFNRLGQLVFESNNPNRKWDGRIGGKAPDSQVFCWVSSYSLNNAPKVIRKGTFVLIR